MFWQMFGKSLGKLFWGSLFSYILIKDLVKQRDSMGELASFEGAS